MHSLITCDDRTGLPIEVLVSEDGSIVIKAKSSSGDISRKLRVRVESGFIALDTIDDPPRGLLTLS